MAHLEINVNAKIHAEIAEGDQEGLAYTPILLDPITKSYSTMAPLTYYNLTIENVYGLENPKILNNGKNSRFTAGGKGECEIKLYIEDELGNSDTDTITIKIT
jgi:hypothetical protein